MTSFQINLLTDKCSKITQAPNSDFTGTSLAVLKGAKELLYYFYFLLCLDVKCNK